MPSIPATHTLQVTPKREHCRCRPKIKRLADQRRRGRNAFPKVRVMQNLRQLAARRQHSDAPVERSDIDAAVGRDRRSVVTPQGVNAFLLVIGLAGFGIETGDHAAIADEIHTPVVMQR